MNLKEIVCESADWINLANEKAQWRTLVNTAMSILVPLKVMNFLAS
jgi:hypothetical protein